MSRFPPRNLFVACGALAIMVFGVVHMVRSGGFQWFLVFWVLVGLGVIGFALRDGFRDRPAGATGAAARFTSRRPTRPEAVIGAVVGAGVLVFGVAQIGSAENVAFMVLWVAFGVAIIAFNLWSAFGRRPD